LAPLEPNFQADVDAVSSIPIVPQLLEVICRSTGMGFAAVARVTEDRWITCSVRDEIAFGLVPGSELKVETTICHEIRQSGQAVIIDQVSLDPAFADHHTPAMYGFESYISVPIIRRDGTFFGTLCAIDPNPAKLNNVHITGMFNMFAELISFHLSSIEQLQAAEKKLLEEREIAELRDQFIAILGHDLLNPVAATLNAAQLLLRMPADERVTKMARIIQDSSYRMKGLIENILDFARGRMGEGIMLDPKYDENLGAVLQHVITELRIIWPDTIIDANIDLNGEVYCDSRRIAQLFSNLLGNAITHGEKDAPVKVEAHNHNGEFTLNISNSGTKIPDEAMEKLFHPFSRGDVRPGQQGLGLGLYISSEIAAAHGGELTAESTDEQTSFTLRMVGC
jgi:signal transduction histidine kinase